MDREVVQAPGAVDREFDQAGAPRGRDGVAECARAAEQDVGEGDVGEPSEDADGRDSEAQAVPEVEGHAGGARQAGQLKGARFLTGAAAAVVVDVSPRRVVREAEVAGEAARHGGEPGRHGLGVGVQCPDAEVAERCLVSG